MIIYCDGGTRGNAICLVHDDIIIVKTRRGEYTNNELEYIALIHTLEYIDSKNLKNVRIYSDSRLIVNQVNGKYRVTTDNLIALHRETLEKMLRCDGVQICWVRRNRNKAGRHLERIKHSLK
jgi:ribonuclease HI